MCFGAGQSVALVVSESFKVVDCLSKLLKEECHEGVPVRQEVVHLLDQEELKDRPRAALTPNDEGKNMSSHRMCMSTQEAMQNPRWARAWKEGRR